MANGPGTPPDPAQLRVEPERVMAAMRLLVAESDRLLDSARRARLQAPWVGPCGADPVSRDAAAAFNHRIDLLVDQCHRYAADLRAAGHALARTARDYGHTDAEIEAALRHTHP
ncbi:WXG100 family type VII secretion target [Pseudonocardia acaciae]|uniref:WXG100 family type VII secretion target n=1 Tax=Pseudonocardia acaciae TaxID=551276 RepID=UPI00048F5194|nr:PE domain-containing protein [Pseudonocardia acaciae]